MEGAVYDLVKYGGSNVFENYEATEVKIKIPFASRVACWSHDYSLS